MAAGAVVAALVPVVAATFWHNVAQEAIFKLQL